MLSKPLLLGASILSAALSFSADAGELRVRPRAVVELFTSQGCSSCPKADAMLEELDSRKDIVALAYHVDYWDYIGWADTFGSPENSALQRDYAASWGSSRIYTPQMVVNGAANVVGSKRREVDAALSAASLSIPVGLTEHGDMLEVAIAPNRSTSDAVVWLVTYRDRAEVDVERGENSGRTLAYSQIVLDRQVLGMWDGETGTQLKLPLAEIMSDGANGAVVLVQEERDGLPGRILGASSIER